MTVKLHARRGIGLRTMSSLEQTKLQSANSPRCIPLALPVRSRV